MEGCKVIVDLFLGPLAGLITAKIESESADSLDEFEFPHAALEVTNEPFFEGANLYRVDFAAVERETARILANVHSKQTMIGEIAGENE
jgi:CYTH domain-containing protein